MPKLMKRVNSVAGLTEQEKFVLSLVDGKTSVKEIARVTGFGLISVNKILEKMNREKVVEFQHAQSSIQSQSQFPKQPQTQSDEQKQTRQSIKDLYATYENADASAILGVPENAALEQIKDAYFEKTKMFHPDSYYARAVPPGDRHFLEDIYKKVQQAYETLKARAPQKGTTEIRTEQKKEPSSGPLRKDTVQPEQTTATTAAQHIITDQIKDRVKKAAVYYKLGIEAFMKNDYSKAYINLKLANSYNPYDKEYIHKMQEAERHMKADRYEDLQKKADISIELNKPEDAIEYLKSAMELTDDKKLLSYKLASVLYDFNLSMKEAKQYCQQAVELDPKNPDYRLLLAKIYKKAGFPKNSLFEYEQAVALGVKADDVKAEIKQLKGLIK